MWLVRRVLKRGRLPTGVVYYHVPDTPSRPNDGLRYVLHN